MAENRSSGPFLPKSRGRPPGAPNKITRDIRAALRDLAESNASRVQEWLDRVAETDPAEAMRLWLTLMRFVAPTLQAAAVADITRQTNPKYRFAEMTDDELMAAILEEHPVLVQEELIPALPGTMAPPAPEDELLR